MRGGSGAFLQEASLEGEEGWKAGATLPTPRQRFQQPWSFPGMGSGPEGGGPGAHLWEAALLIQEGDDAHGLEGQQVQGGPVVGVVDVVPGDALRAVLLLLHGEHVPHKELLQMLVGQVDAELLEAVELQGGDGAEWVRRAGVCGPRGSPRAASSLATVWLASLQSGQGGSAP